MPTATSSARWLPEVAELRRLSHSPAPVSAMNAITAPISTSAAPPNACEPSPASSRPSSVASMARKASRPTVSAITARSQPGGMRRTHGSHSIPSATGMTPT